MTLIDNAKDWWRMLSVRAAAFWTAVQVAWMLMPLDQQMTLIGAILPPERVPVVIALIGFLHTVWGRVTAQPDLHQ